MSGPKRSSLLPLSSVFELTEASAFRITQDYVFSWKKKKNGTGLAPVHIKHANVPKHYKDLVDPPAGSPLNNLVIGTIPAFYKQPSHLKVKDPTKSVSDLMKAGEDEEAKAPSVKPKKTAKAEVYKQQAEDLGNKLGFLPNSPQTKALAALIQRGNNGEAIDVLVGDSESPDALEQAMETVEEVMDALQQSVIYANIEEDEDDEGVLHVEFLPAAFSFAVGAVASQPVAPPPPPPPPAPPAPKPVAKAVPTPAPAPEPEKESELVLQTKTGLAIFDALPGGVQQKLLKALDKKEAGVATQLGLNALHAFWKQDMGEPSALLNKLQTTLKNGFPNKPAVEIFNAAIAFFETLKKAQLIHYNSAGDGNITVDADVVAAISAVTGVKKKPVNISAPPVPPAPAPAAKTPSLVQASGPLGLPSIPPIETLTLVGSAKGELGGYHDKFFVKDAAGNKFLFKPAEPSASNAGAVYSNIAAKVLDHTVPVVTASFVLNPGEAPTAGSIQPIIPNVKTDLSKVALTDLTQSQLGTLMKERVLDWALASHDTKPANFMLTTGGEVVGIDKEQSLKNIGKDELNLTYKPNPTEQLYAKLFKLFSKAKSFSLPLGAMVPVIEKIEAISNEEWTALVDPYIKALPVGERKAKLDAILARKKNLRKDLEGFLTSVLISRGDLSPGDTFQFPKTSEPVEPKKKKKEVVVGGALPPSMGSVLSPVPVPDISSIKKTKEQVPEATGASYFWYGPNGEKYVVKKAVSRNSQNPQPEPFRAVAQEIFSQVSAVVRPGKNLPVGFVPGGFEGVDATIQRWIDGSKPVGKGTDPDSLPASVKQDIAEEHLLDWMLSQNDTHGGNLLIRPDGAVVGIDKEQGFKYLLGFKGIVDEKLSTDFHPNAMYGEAPAYYNKFWAAFGDNKLDFDPTVMLDAVKRIEAIPDADYAKLLSKFAASAPYKDDPKKVAEFMDKAMKRKTNIRADFESFITDLYRKRKKKKTGDFTFAGGWSGDKKAAQPVSAPTPVVGVPLQPVVELASGLKVQVASSPGTTGVFGVLNPKMITASEAVKLTAPEKPVVPAGLPEPSPGKMWKQSTLSAWLKSVTPNGNPVLYKEKPPKKPDATGKMVKDENSPNVMVKLNVSIPDAQAMLDAMNIKTDPPLFEAGGHVIAIVNKEAWENAKAGDKVISTQVDLPPQSVTLTGTSKFTTTPEAGQLKEHVPAVLGISSLNTLMTSKDIGYGRAFATDGKGLNLQSLCVQRCEDASGSFYRFSFKLRPEHRATLVPSTAGAKQLSSYATKEAAYDKTKDSWVQGTASHAAKFGFSASQWQVGNSTLTLADDKASVPFAARNLAFADVRLEPGETLDAGLKRVLGGVSPALAEQIVKTPSEEDIEALKLSAYLWSFAPQVADSLPEGKRNVNDLRETILNAVGKTAAKKKQVEADLSKLELVETALGQITVVLKGRHERMLGADVKYVVRSVKDDLDALTDQLKGATTSMLQRLMQGISTYATSGDDDFVTGGGDYAFCNARGTTKDLPTWSGGQVRLVYDPSELDRLDLISYAAYNGHSGDAFGCTNPNNGSFGHYYRERKPAEETVGREREVIFRSGVNHRKLLKVLCKNKGFSEQLIERLKKEGVERINGMLPEEIIVVGGHSDSATTFYNTYLKDAGY